MDAVVAWRWVMVTIAASHAWAVSTLRWRSWMSHLLIVDAHLGVAARLRYLDKGAELCCLRLDLVLVLAADRWGLHQAVARVVWGLQWWQTLNGPSLLLRSATSWAANGTCWALYMEHTSSILVTPPDDRMSIAASEGWPELLERKIRLRCCSGGSIAWVGSGRARVETSTMSRTLEVGWLVSRGSLCWFSAPCPGCLSPGSAWGAYRSWTAPFTARNRPANSSSLTTLGGAARVCTGVPPLEQSVVMQVCPYTISTQQGKPCLLFRSL